jgi:hypothetical protein
MDDLQRELVRLEATLAQADAPRTAVIDELSAMRRGLARGSDGSAFRLPNVRVGSPCKQRWDDMVGDDRVRVCAGCDRPVFNLSEMTRDEAEGVLATRGVKPCVRFYRRSDGTVMTADCPTAARRSPRLAVLAAGTALLGSSAAMAEPPAPPAADDATPPTQQPADPGATPDPALANAGSDIDVTMGELIEPERVPAHTLIEWSTWVRVSSGIGSHAPNVAARAITQPPAETSGVSEAALSADVSLSVAMDGRLRLGGWGEVRTSSGAVVGGELLVDGLPPHPYGSDFGGAGGVVFRAGGNAHVFTTAIGFGYVGSWSRSDPWIPSVSHVAGVRVILSMNRSLDDPRDFSMMVGAELEPLGALEYIVRRIF